MVVAHIGVTEQLLHGANIGARLEQVRGKAMTKGMTTRRLRYSRLVHSRLDRALHDFFVSMMADRSARVRIPAQRVRREDPLPTPLDCRGGIFARQRGRQPDSRLPQFALTLEAIEQFREIFTQRRRQARGSTVTRSLPPLASRTMISPRSSRRSLTRSRCASINRSPLP